MTTTTSYNERPLPAQVPRVNADGSFVILRPVWIPNFEEVQRMPHKFQVAGFAIVGEFTEDIESMDSLLEAIADIKDDLCAVLMENGYRVKEIGIIGGKLKEESE